MLKLIALARADTPDEAFQLIAIDDSRITQSRTMSGYIKCFSYFEIDWINTPYRILRIKNNEITLNLEKSRKDFSNPGEVLEITEKMKRDTISELFIIKKIT